MRFVLYRPGRGRPPHPSLLLRQVAAGDTLTLWEVQPPPFEPLTLAAGDLVRDPFGQIYVYDGRHRRWIRDIATFTSRGLPVGAGPTGQWLATLHRSGRLPAAQSHARSRLAPRGWRPGRQRAGSRTTERVSEAS